MRRPTIRAGAARPPTALGVIPFTAARRMWTLETFMIFDTEQVQVELLTAAVNVTAPSEIASYAKAFGQLSELAVYGAEARALITSAIDDLGTGGPALPAESF